MIRDCKIAILSPSHFVMLSASGVFLSYAQGRLREESNLISLVFATLVFNSIFNLSN
jgi:hypothetical protein